MRDFTLTIYKRLLGEFLHAGYRFSTIAEFIQDPDKKERIIILRHDVDKKPLLSQQTAEMENELGIKGTYYFRVVKNALPKEVIERIAKLGHEIGYHYDDLNVAAGVVESALDLFQKNLAKLRELVPIKTVCMHGSPLSKHDNRDLWEKFDYHNFGIIGEPYFDIDFNNVKYFTDTGRRWDGEKVSIRDRVTGNGLCDPPVFNPHSTADIITALKNNCFPDKIMLTIHPQRWTDNYILWIEELIWQKIKNMIKYLKIKKMEKNKKKINGK